jgi:hypothetical protein
MHNFCRWMVLPHSTLYICKSDTVNSSLELIPRPIPSFSVMHADKLESLYYYYLASSPGAPIFSTLACVEKIGAPGDDANYYYYYSSWQCTSECA